MSDGDDWTTLEPTAKVSPKADVRLGFRKYRSGVCGTLLIRREVLDKMNLAHHRVNIRVGSGHRAHQIAVVPADDGRFELLEVGTAKGGGVWRVTLPVVPNWQAAPCEACERNYSFEPSAPGSKHKMLVVELPHELWHKPKSGGQWSGVKRDGVTKV